MHQPQHDSLAQHSYATRIRQNIAIKPSIRLRHPSPPTHPPQFPPPGIVLHPDDANSKVLLAIGRSFLSVDNRAMTIKDLAEMTATFGLVCQNMSAASQAITTYIRAHIQRCEEQQDQPLLLRHVLSGTPSDDDLLPALHSRSGGAHCAATQDNRVTNFRRGTVVWYLSRSTGAPCPFTRAGIRLCNYSENGNKASMSTTKENKRREWEKQARCGEKRKRPLRGCVAKTIDSDNDEGQPPPKVKLTLRLKPLQCRAPSASTSTAHTRSESTRNLSFSKDSDDSDSESSDNDSMSVDSSSSEEDEAPSPPQPVEEEPWSLPPYPRKSISIPCYTPSLNDDPYPCYPSPYAQNGIYRRSPSVACSVGSLPPDSEDEDDDFHITMTGARRRHSTAPRFSNSDADGWDADLDSEGDGDMWESPGPRSPSAPAMLPEIAVKEEPTDLQGMLEAWEDLDSTLADTKVVEAIAQAAASVLEGESMSRVKQESVDAWSWESAYTNSHQHWNFDADSDHQLTRIKQEDVDFDNPFMLGPSSPLSPLSQLPSLTYSDSPSPESSRDVSEPNEKQYATLRPRAKTQPVPFSYFHTSSSSLPGPSTPPRGSSKPELVIVPPPPSATHSLAALIQSMSMNSPSAVAPSSLLIPPSSSLQDTPASDVVVVHTCQPCTPAISATSVEGISVYQMMLGPFQLLRRIDTDFVNLSTIVAYSGAPGPAPHTIPNAIAVTKGSVMVSGTWVPLAVAQAYVRDHNPLQNSPLHTFLSDTLYERFPTALQDYYRRSMQGRMLGQFGPHFGSTIQATQLCGASAVEHTPTIPPGWEEPPVTAFSLALSMPLSERMAEPELPLSPSEQEIFHVLCGAPEWDKENSPPSSPTVGEQMKNAFISSVVEVQTAQPELVKVTDNTTTTTTDRPLRRSKRVADAMAAQPPPTTMKTRTRRGGSRNSMF